MLCCRCLHPKPLVEFEPEMVTTPLTGHLVQSMPRHSAAAGTETSRRSLRLQSMQQSFPRQCKSGRTGRTHLSQFAAGVFALFHSIQCASACGQRQCRPMASDSATVQAVGSRQRMDSQSDAAYSCTDSDRSLLSQAALGKKSPRSLYTGLGTGRSHTNDSQIRLMLLTTACL